jgi:excisionase family DNA binding protein
MPRRRTDDTTAAPPSATGDGNLRGYTPREAARVLRASPDKVRALIQSGHLAAINMATPGARKPRYVILPEHLAEFARSRRVVAMPATAPATRRKRTTGGIDYYPD